MSGQTLREAIVPDGTEMPFFCWSSAAVSPFTGRPNLSGPSIWLLSGHNTDTAWGVIVCGNICPLQPTVSTVCKCHWWSWGILCCYLAVSRRAWFLIIFFRARVQIRLPTIYYGQLDMINSFWCEHNKEALLRSNISEHEQNKHFSHSAWRDLITDLTQSIHLHNWARLTYPGFYACLCVCVCDNIYISAQREERRVAAWTASWCESSHCFAPC